MTKHNRNDTPMHSSAPGADEHGFDQAAMDEVMKKYDRESNTRVWEGWQKWAVYAVMAFYSLFVIYVTLFATWLDLIRYPSFVGGILLVGYLNYPVKKGVQRVNHIPWYDWILMLAGAAAFFYVVVNAHSLTVRLGMSQVRPYEIAIGVVGILTLLELCRRAVGIPILCVAGVFMGYALYYYAGIKHLSAAATVRNVTVSLFYKVQGGGILGTPIQVCAKFILVFIIFGAFLERTGIAQFFIDLANSLVGRFSGGPAKVAVISSALCGMVSGSSVGNTVTTGSVTIPMMKKTGYRPEFAGAVEAAASTGGQIMPPIMGAAAFLVAEILGVRYWDVVKAAIIPAILFYVALLIAVDLYALSHGLVGMKRSELPPLSKTIRGIWKFSPMLVLILMIGPMNFTITRSGVYTFLFTLALSFVSKETRLNREKLTQFLYSAGRGCCTVAIACAVVGIIIGTVTGTGLSYRLSSILVDIAGGKLALLLIITMFAAIILGMGLPSSACYLVLATLVAPAIIQLGVLPMAAHLFVFYYGIISNVTPPVAMAAYAAAGIADCNPSRCGFQAFRLSIAGFLLPFFFVYNNVLLFDGTPFAILVAFLGAVVGIYCLACSMQGYIWNAPINYRGRVLLFAAAISLIDSAVLTDMIGLALMIAVHVFFNIRKKNAVPVTQ